MTKRPTFEAFKAEALQNSEVLAEYNALGDNYELKRRMIAMRKAAGLTVSAFKSIAKLPPLWRGLRIGLRFKQRDCVKKHTGPGEGIVKRFNEYQFLVGTTN